MSRTTRKKTFTDPILKKGHVHVEKERTERDVLDEELRNLEWEAWVAQCDAEMDAHLNQEDYDRWLQALADEEDSNE